VIREHILQFYDNLFTEQFSWQPRLDGLIFDWIEGGRRPFDWRGRSRKKRSSWW
jgi:hypothetical protein